MAYMSQQKKAALAPAIKAVLKEFNMKGSIAVNNHSTLVVNIKSGDINFGEDYIQVNPYGSMSITKALPRSFLTSCLPL